MKKLKASTKSLASLFITIKHLCQLSSVDDITRLTRFIVCLLFAFYFDAILDQSPNSDIAQHAVVFSHDIECTLRDFVEAPDEGYQE